MDGKMIVTVRHEKVADPAALGLASFALTTFMLSAHNAGWAPDIIWVSLALFYGGVVQVLAGMWEFRRNNTFAATAFSTYGAFWLSLAVFVLLLLTGLVPPEVDLNRALGFFLASFFIFNTLLFAASTMISKAIFVVFLLLEVTFGCLFIGHFCHQSAGERPSWTVAGGYMGIFTAIGAWYCSFAVLMNETAKKVIIPVGAPFLSFSDAGGAHHSGLSMNKEDL